MSHDLSRRNLLGLMAAAPVAAVAKPLPAEPLRQVLIDDSFITVNLRDVHDTIYGSGGGAGGEWIEIARWRAARPDRLIGECIKDYNSLSNCQDRPLPQEAPLLLSADDEGPGAPAKVRAAPPAPQAHQIPPKPAPDISWSCGWFEKSGRCLRYHCAKGAPCGGYEGDDLILQHARAC